MNAGLIKLLVTGTVSAAGGAFAYRKTKVGGTYFKFWKKEFWTGKQSVEQKNQDTINNS